MTAAEDPGRAREAGKLVVRNAMFLAFAKVVATPLSMFVNAMMARHLGPEEFGFIYVASTYASLAFLFVDWGQGGTLPALVARDHAKAGQLLGSGLGWRLVTAVLASVLAVLGCWIAGYEGAFLAALALICLTSALTSAAAGCQDTIRGFERTDVAALGYVGQQFLAAVIIVPTLMLGGRLRAALLAQTAAVAITLFFVWRALRPTGVGKLAFDRSALRLLLAKGLPFLFFDLIMALQPNVDAVFLSHYASPQAVGWYAAARKLTGFLVYPVNALASALYPTLSRLHAEDTQAYGRTSSGALRAGAVLAVPVALGCLLYPDIGVQLFSRQSFHEAETDLRILAGFVFLVYFSIVIGTSLLAAGKARPWTIIQFLCVAISAGLDPFLVPWFEVHYGNGGLGICVSTVASEVLMVAGGIWLMDKSAFDRALFKQLAQAAVSGLTMFACSRLLLGVSSLLSAVASTAAYFVCLVLVGGLDQEQTQAIRAFFGRKFSRRGPK